MGLFSELKKAELWDRLEPGESLRSISRVLGRAPSLVRTDLSVHTQHDLDQAAYSLNTRPRTTLE